MGVGVLGRQFAGGAKFGQSFLLLQHQKAPSLRADGAQTWRWVQVSLLHLEPTTSQIFNYSSLRPSFGQTATVDGEFSLVVKIYLTVAGDVSDVIDTIR